MIFVAVGTQLPFDRMIKIIDDWATSRGCFEVVAQIGPSAFKARTITTHAYIEPERFIEMQRNASLLVGHAGMGTILGALELAKPLIIMPRLASFGEHRNDHQLATAQRFADRDGIYVAEDSVSMTAILDRRLELTGDKNPISSYASGQLISFLTEFIMRS